MSVEIIVALITVGVTGICAIGGYLFAYFHKLHLAQREDRLRFIARQIDEFYGPLYVILTSIKKTFNLLISKAKEDAGYKVEEEPSSHEMSEALRQKMIDRFVKEHRPKSADEISEWRLWVETISMPWRRKVKDILLSKAHLLIDEELPECIVDYVSYVGEWEGILKRWEMGDFSQVRSVLFKYPTELQKYAEECYRDLKKKQLELLGEKGIRPTGKKKTSASACAGATTSPESFRQGCSIGMRHARLQ
ncbi:MAG: hypothetical protein E3J71_09605 [Candidatus Stahlbacteria bacterium]|nr:MAG: hypothetical protein E3J71_09605 [Candidatus Stahlbacteria bacterium]